MTFNCERSDEGLEIENSLEKLEKFLYLDGTLTVSGRADSAVAGREWCAWCKCQ